MHLLLQFSLWLLLINNAWIAGSMITYISRILISNSNLCFASISSLPSPIWWEDFIILSPAFSNSQQASPPSWTYSFHTKNIFWNVKVLPGLKVSFYRSWTQFLVHHLFFNSVIAWDEVAALALSKSKDFQVVQHIP